MHFHSRFKDVLRKQPVVNAVEGSSVRTQELRRPVSAMALRTHTQEMPDSDLSKEYHIAAPTTDSKRDRRVSQHRRHTRIVSEGCLRAMIESPKVDFPDVVEAQGQP